jgi:RNA polymerase sigma factor (sigma-70 family)
VHSAAHFGVERELRWYVVDRIDNETAFVAMIPPARALSAARRAETRAGRPKATPEEVFALVHAQVHKLAGRRDARELVQVAAEHAFRGLPRFEGRSQLATWTFRICYLTIRKHDRWYRRWLRRFTVTADGELPERADEAAAGDERAIATERVHRLRHALDQLSAKRRAVVVLHDLEGLAVDEIATVVGASPVAVRSRLRDGRKMLAEILMNDPYFGDTACGRRDKR